MKIIIKNNRLARIFALGTLAVVTLTVMAGLSGVAVAQNWPTGTVTVVVPFPPGGPSDIAARPVSQALSESLKQSFVIDNRPGSGGNIGSAAVAKAEPNGNTILVSSSAPIVINPSLYSKMSFDPAKDLIPVSNLLRVPLVLVVHPSVPANNLAELLAYIKSNPDSAYASAGSGTPQHLTGELFKTATGLDKLTHIPYKGSSDAIKDVLGGHVPMLFDSTVAIVPHIKSGKVKVIAISSAQRSLLLPNVPTFKESGSNVESYAWYGMFVPAKTPANIVKKLNAETLKAMRGAEYQKVLESTGSDFVGTSPEVFAEFVKAEAAKWAKLVKASGAQVD